MATRREFLRNAAAAGSAAVFGTVAAAALAAACGPASVIPAATPRTYRIGVLMSRGVPPCEHEPNVWQAMAWGQIKTNAQPLAESCPQTVFRSALERRGYRVGDN